MKANRVSALFMLLLSVVSEPAFASLEQIINNADGDLSSHQPASKIARYFVGLDPALNDSGTKVLTSMTVDRVAGTLALIIAPDGRFEKDMTSTNFKCGVFTVTNESSTLYAAKAERSNDRQHGVSTDQTVYRAECRDDRRDKHSVVVMVDSGSYAVISNNESRHPAEPSFQVVFGPMPQKK